MKKTFKKHPYIYSAVILVVIITVIYLISSRNGKTEQTMIVRHTDFVSTVSVSGKVVAVQNADLGFDQSGRISSINAKVGDKVSAGMVLASIDSGDLRAGLSQKQANLEKEQAKLAALKVGTRPEEVALYEQKFADAGTAFIVAMKSAYLQTENAVKNKADTLFTNGDSVNPTMNVQTQSDNEKRSIENDRIIVREKLAAWKDILTSVTATTSSISAAKNVSTEVLMLTKSFFDRLGTVTGNLSPASSGLSQATIDTYRTSINSGAQEVSAAASTEQVADANWSGARDTLTLQRSGSTREDIDAQVATIKAAEADLENARAQLSKTTVLAPFDGIVTKIDAKIGEITSPSKSEITIMSNGAFLIESYVPEINIASIALGNHAQVTLDAYGGEVLFAASIITIDPAETVRDGVSTYRIKLLFDVNDPRVKSGMTANVIITTADKADTITVPQGIITNKDGQKFVTKKVGGVNKEVVVTTGGISSFGQIEITSGLDDGDIVVLK